MAVTMKDIAERAGVSRPVVCAVLGGKSTCRVSDEKKQRILELVKELGFQPNLQAQRLRSGKTRTVGILFASFRDRIIGDVMMELYRRLLKSGYTSIFAIWEKASEIEQAYKNVIRNQVDGIITCDYHPDGFRKRFRLSSMGSSILKQTAFQLITALRFRKRRNICVRLVTAVSGISGVMESVMKIMPPSWINTVLRTAVMFSTGMDIMKTEQGNAIFPRMENRRPQFSS